MKVIGSVNFGLPGIEHVDYLDDRSLRDFDIAIFAPRFPYMYRTEFDAGGSCISIEGTGTLVKAMSHWRQEISDALSAGKTIVFVADRYKEDQAAYSSTSKRKGETTYNTQTINNYTVLPCNLVPRASKGEKFRSAPSLFSALFKTLGEGAEYRTVFGSVFQKVLV